MNMFIFIILKIVFVVNKVKRKSKHSFEILLCYGASPIIIFRANLIIILTTGEMTIKFLFY